MRELVVRLQSSYDVSERRACDMLDFARSSHTYISKQDGQAELRMRIREIAAARVRYGYRRICVLLRREGWMVNYKRVYRLYCEEGLNLRSKRPRRRVASAHRVERREVSTINECWSMDFVSDSLFNGRRFRALTIVDNFSRECLWIEAAQSLRGEEVVSVLKYLKQSRGVPKSIRCDNGPEFISKVLDRWAYENGVTLDYSRPGKPTDNAFVESFNGSFRDECLNVNWFLSMEDDRDKIETWRVDYNEYRPHSSLEEMTPSYFAKTTVRKEAEKAA